VTSRAAEGRAAIVAGNEGRTPPGAPSGGPGPGGIVLVAKPAGLTSFKALAPVKRRLGTRHLGHTGTLDSFASGLLVVLAGAYTRLGPWFTAFDKLYVARLVFGEETDTLDPEGSVVATAPLPERAALEAVLPAFRGAILQAPPAYSALHIEGERASERARRGETLVMKERPVTISLLELEDFEGREATLRVRCSSGTYIRSLARDLALAVGSRARLSGLERLEVGPFALAGARPADELEPGRDLLPLDPELATRMGFVPAFMDAATLSRFSKGAFIDPQALRFGTEGPGRGQAPTSPLAMFSPSLEFRGVMNLEGGALRYRFVIGEGR